jgi:hypothetical protein
LVVGKSAPTGQEAFARSWRQAGPSLAFCTWDRFGELSHYHSDLQGPSLPVNHYQRGCIPGSLACFPSRWVYYWPRGLGHVWIACWQAANWLQFSPPRMQKSGLSWETGEYGLLAPPFPHCWEVLSQSTPSLYHVKALNWNCSTRRPMSWAESLQLEGQRGQNESWPHSSEDSLPLTWQLGLAVHPVLKLSLFCDSHLLFPVSTEELR